MINLLVNCLRVQLSVCLLISCLPSFAEAELPLPPVGYWKSFDDVTSLPDAEVRITEANNQLTGTVVRDLITAANDKPLICDKCADDRKGKPVVGMQIIRYVRFNPDDNVWAGGQILDPDEGRIYKIRLKLLDGGKKMQVRGYFGLFYRTQIWERLPDPAIAFGH